MIPIMEHAYSPSPTPSKGNDKVLISIDDTALLQGDSSPRSMEGGPSLRGHSKSLNRLDRMEEDVDRGEAIFKCPSYPRLLGSRDRLVNVDPSITHVDTDSISPRVSTDNLSYQDRERLPHAGGLVRSVSARIVDSLPPLELGNQTETKGTTANFLSPGENGNSLVSRSTSCPSMAYRRSPCPSPTSHHSPRPIGRISCPSGSGMHGASAGANARPQRASVHEINLEGEVIKDLPIEPRQSFPDFIPEEPVAAVKSQVEEHPMHTRRLKEGALDRDKFARINGDHHKPRINVKETQKTSARLRQGYFNIGDIPSTLAQKVISEHNTYKPEVDDRVQAKCLQWLNSLDHD